MMDKARRKTDKRLRKMERDVGRIYRQYPALISAEKQYNEYMKKVEEQTEAAYRAYKGAGAEEQKELKEAYAKEVKALTIGSTEYKRVAKNFTEAVTKANQAALDIVNDEMVSIYTENYNQIAEECRRVGIKVNGKKQS